MSVAGIDSSSLGMLCEFCANFCCVNRFVSISPEKTCTAELVGDRFARISSERTCTAELVGDRSVSI